MGTEQPSTIKINNASFVARAYDLPIVCQTGEVVLTITRKLGVLECYNSPIDNNDGDFIRFKISVDISKPIIKGIHIWFNGDQM